MTFTLDEFHRDTPNEELLADLKRVAGILASDRVTMDVYREHGRFHPSTLQRRFGSWFAALDAAGLSRTRTLGVTDDDLFANLAEVWERLGRQPRYLEVCKPHSRFVVETYANRFGTWRKALAAFVAWANVSELGMLTEPRPAPPGRSKPVTPRVRWRVMQRDGFRCVACGRSPANEPGVRLHVDHRVSRQAGGPSDLGNLDTLCERCNLGKGSLSVRIPYNDC